MKPEQLIINCYAEKEGDQWVAVCVDFNLAAQGDTFENAKIKLEAMIKEYVYDALEGQDKAYAGQLLSRKAPWPLLLKYYLIMLKLHFNTDTEKVFDEVMPLKAA